MDDLISIIVSWILYFIFYGFIIPFSLMIVFGYLSVFGFILYGIWEFLTTGSFKKSGKMLGIGRDPISDSTLLIDKKIRFLFYFTSGFTLIFLFYYFFMN